MLASAAPSVASGWPTFVANTVTIALACYGAVKWMSRKVVKPLDQIPEVANTVAKLDARLTTVETQTAEVVTELHPDHGKSLRDVVDRTEKRGLKNAQQLKADRKVILTHLGADAEFQTRTLSFESKTERALAALAGGRREHDPPPEELKVRSTA